MLKEVISVKGLSKDYWIKKKKIPALKSVDIAAKEQEFISIMGPSGCGKSTLLKMIAGIEEADSGELIINNVNYTDGVPQSVKRKIAFVYQNNNLLEWRTVEKNLYLPLEMFGLKKDESWEEKAGEALRIVGLQDYKNAYPKELSGGMKQRVGIARALLCDAEILLLDQPFGALDAITRKMIGYEFYSIFEKAKKTIVMVTNNIEEAILFSDRIYLFSQSPGQVEAVVDIDIPSEQRNQSLIKNERFNELRLKMIKLIKKQHMQEEKNTQKAAEK